MGTPLDGARGPSGAGDHGAHARLSLGRRWRWIVADASVASASTFHVGEYLTPLLLVDGPTASRPIPERDPATGFVSTAVRVGMETPTRPAAFRVTAGLGWMHGVDAAFRSLGWTGLVGSGAIRGSLGIERSWFDMPVQDHLVERQRVVGVPIPGTRHTTPTHTTALHLGVELRLGR